MLVVPKTSWLVVLDKVRAAKLGEALCCRSWSKVTSLPVTVKIREAVPPAMVKPSAAEVRVRPLIEPSTDKLATLAPSELVIIRVLVAAAFRSKVVSPPVKGMLASATVRASKVLAPVKVWVPAKEARVPVIAGIVTVMSEPGSAAVKAISKVSGVAPSNQRVLPVSAPVKAGR